MEITEYVFGLCDKAKEAGDVLAYAQTDEKNRALMKIASALREKSGYILEENRKDLELAETNGVPKTMRDRLMLNEERIEGIAKATEKLVMLLDPCGEGSVSTRPNGLKISVINVPIGVIGIIYEARPNVTADAAALCLKSGNAAVLKGGKEAINTNRAIMKTMKDAIGEFSFGSEVIQLIDSTDREATKALMNAVGKIDVLIPRGGKGLINAVVKEAKVPVIETGAGNCHIYIDESADLEKSLRVAVNAKVSRPSVCNAVETMLVNEKVADKFLPMYAEAVSKWNVEIRGCDKTCRILSKAVPASESDYETEFNDYIIAVKVVKDVGEAIAHIKKYTTGHSEAIMTENLQNARRFCRETDAAAVYVNASTRFTDGGEFGMGAEIGISTQKLHARGPMGLKQLTTVKYVVEGDGQIR